MHQSGYFYIMTNAHHTVLYCGAKNDLHRGVDGHKNGVYANSFTLRYNINKLAYFEISTLIADAFNKEKQMKAGSMKKKIDLIKGANPEWKDLSEQFGTSSGEELIRLKKYLRDPNKSSK